MHKDTFHLVSEDGLKLFGRKWAPEGDCKAVICLVHGLAEHTGRYENFASYFTSEGIGVIGLDLRGHGHSEGKRGHAKSMDILLSDIRLLLLETRRLYMETPVFLFGHSLGGSLAAQFAIKNSSKELAGVIISSPWFKLAFEPPPWKNLLGKLIGGIYPAFSVPVDLDPMELSKDPEIGREYLEDPLVHNEISASLYYSILRTGESAILNASGINFPALVYHGSDDKITSFPATSAFAENAGRKVQFKRWDGLRHEPHNEKEKYAVFNLINSWISGILKDFPHSADR